MYRGGKPILESTPINIPNANQCQRNHNYCKYCDHKYSSAQSFCKHLFTLKHYENCGLTELVKMELIRKRICQLQRGAKPKCSGASYRGIALQEYELGLLSVRH